MLTPAFLESLPDDVVELYAQAEEAILADMARRIANTDLWTPSADWQYRKLRESGAVSEEIIAELSRLTGKTQTEIRKLMQEAAIESLGYDEGIYETHGMTGEPLASSKALTEILNAGYRATVATMRNLTRTTANTASQQFERALDKAWMEVQSGAFSTDAAVKSAVKELAAKGLECVKYPSGHKDTLEVAVRRAVVTGVNQTCGQMQVERAEELGADLMELTAHAGARPSHAEWQGQIVSLSGQPGYLSLEDIGYGDVAGFKGANCRHDWNPWFEGMPRTWTPEALVKLNEPKYEYNGKKYTEYEASQIQRYNERQIRRWKREYAAMKAAGQDTTGASVKLAAWNKRQEDFLQQTGFKRRQSREEIAGFGYKDQKNASNEAIEYYNVWSKSMGVDDAIKTLANYYEVKYTDSPRYELLRRYVRDVNSGWLSPLSGFANYEGLYNRIQTEIVGRTTVNGVLITGQSEHFLQRVIGTMVDPKIFKEDHQIIRRSGVEFEDIMDAVSRGMPRKIRNNPNGRSQNLWRKTV